MTFEYQFPISTPRFTTEEFEQKKQEYNSKYGYEVHIPGFEEIIHYRVTPEPSKAELSLYHKKDVSSLGEKRYNEIKELMTQKRERFLTMLGSPSPKIVRNAASFLTFLDDINDTLGTAGVIARVIAHRMPHMIGKTLIGPAGWLFTAAEIADIGLTLARLPWKARRLQHELNQAIKDQPFSKRAKLRRLNKLKRLNLSKGEIIEGLQTTDNIFGIGLSLGPIMSLLYDIPSGFIRHLQGKPVKITGLPAPLQWFDKIWSNQLKSAAQIWTGISGDDDAILYKNMIAHNLAAQMQQNYLQETSPLDFIPDTQGLQMPVPMPHHPSTEAVILAEVPSIEQYSGWPTTDSRWMDPADVWERDKDEIQENITNFLDRNRHNTEAMVATQNAVESGLNILANAEGPDALALDYDATSTTLLKLLNNNLRLPPDTTPEQLSCFTSNTTAFDTAGLLPDPEEIQSMAKQNCGLEFTTEVPARNTVPYSLLHKAHDSPIWSLQDWYFKKCLKAQSFLTGRGAQIHPYAVPDQILKRDKALNWLRLNGYNWKQVTSMTIHWQPEWAERMSI